MKREDKLVAIPVAGMKEDAVAAYWLGRTMVHLPHPRTQHAAARLRFSRLVWQDRGR